MRQLQHNIAEKSDRITLNDTDGNLLITKEKHYEAEHFLVGACVFTAVHFEITEQGLEQYETAIKGSETARESGRGQIVPSLLDEPHEKYQESKLSFIIDCDSYTPEKLMHIGYVALNMIPANANLEFVKSDRTEPNENNNLLAA